MPVTVDHEFVCMSQDQFATDGFGVAEKMLVVELLSEWGTGLSRRLYEEAIVHLCCGTQNALSDVDVALDGVVIAKQQMLLCAKRSALRVTSFDHGSGGYSNDLTRLIKRTDIDHVQWVNIDRGVLSFTTLG
ncbi:MAG: hypothetical protein PHO37_01245 [Kiritimatiellae bacterium]|nr:hypothetical protein [Kiritimatiellia bacterium]